MMRLTKVTTPNGGTERGAYTELRKEGPGGMQPNVIRIRDRAYSMPTSGGSLMLAIFRRSLFCPLICQQSQEYFSLRVGMHLLKTFFEEGQVLLMNVLLHGLIGARLMARP